MTNQNKIRLCSSVFFGHIILTCSLNFTRIYHFLVHFYLLFYVEGANTGNSSVIRFLIFLSIIFLFFSVIETGRQLCGVMHWWTHYIINIIIWLRSRYIVISVAVMMSLFPRCFGPPSNSWQSKLSIKQR